MFPNVTERVNKKCLKKRIIIAIFSCPGIFHITIFLLIKAKASMNFYYISCSIDKKNLLSDLDKSPTYIVINSIYICIYHYQHPHYLIHL